MDIRTAKTAFLNKLSDVTPLQKQGVSLVIDCLIENEVKDEDIPVVITGYNDFDRQAVCRLSKKFCQQMYPDAQNLFEPEPLLIGGDNVENACINLIKHMRERRSALLYWADSTSWFKHLPSGLFQVVCLERTTAFRGYNELSSSAINVNQKEYTTDQLMTELFSGVKHINTQQEVSATEAHGLFYYEARSGLIRPIPAPAGKRYDDKITLDSALWQKLACVALRRFQSKECNDGFNWDESDEGWTDVTVIPIVKELCINASGEIRQCLIGQVSMEDDGSGNLLLSTVWIHPFYRRKGYLTDLWPKLKEMYGDFKVSQPNSNMQAFLKTIGE